MSRTFDSVGELTLLHALEYNARFSPEATFVEWQGDQLSYGRFEEMTNSFAHRLRTRNVQAGQSVMLFMRNCPEYLIAMFAIMKAGAIYVTCSAHYQDEEIGFQLRDSLSRVIVTDDVDRISRVTKKMPGEFEIVNCSKLEGPPGAGLSEEIKGMPTTWIDPLPSPDDLAIVMYTSGSTDHPKGVMWTHGQFYTGAQRCMNAYQYREDERILHFFPLYHGNGGSNLLGPIILVGGTIVLQEKFSASRFIADLVRTRATMTALNASHVKLILKQPESIYDRAHDVRRVQFGLPLDLERRMQFEERFGIRLVESYGQTECLGMAAASPVCANRTVASAGPPVPGVQLQIVNSDGEALPAGSPGEIRLKADSRHGLCLGYFGNEEATQRLFSDGWLKTGDVGYIDSSGSLVFLERQKDMIKRSGFNVAAAEVERVILEHPAVTECAVVSVPDDIQDEAIVAFVVSTTALTPEEIISFCVDRLAMYKTPSHVQFLEYLPEGFVGKIDKQELRLRARQAFGMEHGDVNSV